MSSVNSVNSNSGSQAAGGANSLTSQTMIDKTEFLNLLVAQLQNQDPMNPMDNQEFVAQLATFSSLEQLISINEGVTKLATSEEAAPDLMSET